ncbi:hypothetical protein SCRDD08_01984 [Streptococcus cristatus]|uniref:Uncharacterized protein n=1 Tax=Streptococcus cristatus TaxID=45634 RepID=A0A139MXH4_STRCR|nr:hypothetical protein SCRDD08_01984 [Streptococcus cristatus]
MFYDILKQERSRVTDVGSMFVAFCCIERNLEKEETNGFTKF